MIVLIAHHLTLVTGYKQSLFFLVSFCNWFAFMWIRICCPEERKKKECTELRTPKWQHFSLDARSAWEHFSSFWFCVQFTDLFVQYCIVFTSITTHAISFSNFHRKIPKTCLCYCLLYNTIGAMGYRLWDIRYNGVTPKVDINVNENGRNEMKWNETQNTEHKTKQKGLTK